MTSGITKRTGVAIIGCGYWGMNYVRVLNELVESQVVMVCDQKPERLSDVAKRFPGIDVTTQVADVVADQRVNAVVVCTEAASHYDLARVFLLGDKHVMLEKPMTKYAWQAEELSRLAEAQHRILMVGHTFLYNEGVRKVKELIAQNTGRIYYLHACRTNLGPVRHDVSATWDLASHDVAIFNYLLETRPLSVSAIGAKVLGNCRDDVAFISLFYPGSIVGHIHVSWADPNKAREVVVVCSDRRIVFNDLNGSEQVRIFEKGISTVSTEPLSFGEQQLQIRDGDILSPKIKAVEPLKEECRHFLSCVANGAAPLTSGWQGQDVIRVLEAIDRSIQAHGAEVEVFSNAKQSAFRAAA